MKIAVMQPYFLPYIGYFQLMAAVDRFVILDDVHFINRGWINRNRLLLHGSPHMFTVPLRAASQNRRISDIDVVDEPQWRERLIRTVRQAYSRAPLFQKVFPMFERMVSFQRIHLKDYLLNALTEVTSYLNIPVEVVKTSADYRNSELKGWRRIVDICRKENADTYINPIGGTDLYPREEFQSQGINLYFLQSRKITYSQGECPHVPWLSILDVLMFNDVATVQQFLLERDFV